MRKQTNLAEVKLTALALLSTEINETPYSPMIVKHPFTDTGLTALPDGNGGITMINLMEEDAQNRWRQTMAQSINKANSAYEIYMMVTKPYALTFLKFAQPSLSREDMSQILASAWTRSEAPHQDVNVTVNQLLRMFKQADPTCLMEQDEYIQFKTLDDTVTVYRGVTPHNAKSVKALFKLKANQADLLGTLIRQIEVMQDRTSRNQELIRQIDKEIADLGAKNLVITRLHTSGVLGAADYAKQTSEIGNRITDLRIERRKKLTEDEDDILLDTLKELNGILEEYEPTTEFDGELFEQIVQDITVNDNTQITFRLLGDIQLTEKINEKGRCKSA